MARKVTCPECGTVIEDTGNAVYKHAVACFHIRDKGRDQVLAELSIDRSVYANRVRELLEAHTGGGD